MVPPLPARGLSVKNTKAAIAMAAFVFGGEEDFNFMKLCAIRGTVDLWISEQLCSNFKQLFATLSRV